MRDVYGWTKLHPHRRSIEPGLCPGARDDLNTIATIAVQRNAAESNP